LYIENQVKLRFYADWQEKRRTQTLIQELSQGKAAYMTWGKLGFLYQENFFKPVVG